MRRWAHRASRRRMRQKRREHCAPCCLASAQWCAGSVRRAQSVLQCGGVRGDCTGAHALHREIARSRWSLLAVSIAAAQASTRCAHCASRLPSRRISLTAAYTPRYESTTVNLSRLCSALARRLRFGPRPPIDLPCRRIAIVECAERFALSESLSAGRRCAQLRLRQKAGVGGMEPRVCKQAAYSRACLSAGSMFL